ncbi:MAG: hypothetical protein U1D30_26315 [Planctomycetota bacterium]
MLRTRVNTPAWVPGIGLLFLFFAFETPADPPSTTQPSDETQQVAHRLVEDLASPDFQTRDRAQRELLELGRPAESALQKAYNSEDIEQRLRVREILKEHSRRDLWNPSLVHLHEKGMPAAEIFRRIAEQTGNPINWARTPKSFHQAIDADWDGVSYWEAMDDLSRRSSIVPRVYDDPSLSGIVLTHGSAGTFPIAYAGPTRMQLLTMKRSSARSINFGDGVADEEESLDLSMSLTWEQRFHLCRYTGRPRITAAVTDTGEQLGSLRPPVSGMMHLARRQRQLVFSTRLRPPTQPATKWKSLRIEFDMVACGDFETLSVDLKDSSRRIESDGYELELESIVAENESSVVSLRWTRPTPYDKMNLPDMADEFLLVVDEGGRELPFILQQVVGDEESVRYVVHVPHKAGIPVGIRYRVALLKSSRTVGFEFQDIPIP